MDAKLVHTSKGTNVFILFYGSNRFCWVSDEDAKCGNWLVGDNGELMLFLDKPPKSSGGFWYICPERDAWVCVETMEECPLDHEEAIKAAEALGTAWAEENLEKGCYALRDVFALSRAAYLPPFPVFPREELYDAAVNAAWRKGQPE